MLESLVNKVVSAQQTPAQVFPCEFFEIVSGQFLSRKIAPWLGLALDLELRIRIRVVSNFPLGQLSENLLKCLRTPSFIEISIHCLFLDKHNNYFQT